MSHEITERANGKAEMAYVGATPWHGLGQTLTESATIEQWKCEAGMDWTVCRSRVRYGEGDTQRVYEDQHVLYRSDTKAPLGVVSKNYKIVNPGDCLEFFRDLTAGQGFTLETAGTLFGGKRYWALARINKEAVIKGKDRIGGYLLLSSSADGSLATQARLTSIRVVCNNTLTAAFGAKADARCLHRSTFSGDRMKDQLGVSRESFDKFAEACAALAKVRMNSMQAGEFVKKLLVEQKVTARIDKVTELPAYQRILGLFGGAGLGSTLLSAEGTAWGAVNAVTEYVDHHAKADHSANRLFNAWWGRGETLKNAAFAQALALV